MSCQTVRDRLLELVDAVELPPDVAEHLEACAACREHFEMLRRHQGLLAGVPSPSAPMQLWRRIESEIVDGGRTRVRRLWWAAAAAVVLLAFSLTRLIPQEEPVVVHQPEPSVEEVKVAGNGKSVDYLVTRHLALQNGNILNDTLVQENEQTEYLLMVAGDVP